MNVKKRSAGWLLASFLSGTCYAHGLGPWGQVLDWHNDQIDQTIGRGGASQKVSIEGRDCLTGRDFHFKINDEYAFDIDETVWVDVEFRLGTADIKVVLSYGGNDQSAQQISSQKQLQLPKGTSSRWYKQSITFERARFANLGFEGTDFGMSSDRAFTVCAIALRRSYTTPVNKTFGQVSIEVFDQAGRSTAARMAIYDSSGRMPLPSSDALALRNSLFGVTRVIKLGGSLDFMGDSLLPPWPGANRTVFYSDGRYHSRLPVGEYKLIVAKGPEYRIARQDLSVRAHSTQSVKVKLRRWTDMAAKGWYSGEDHIHYTRSSAQDDHDLLLFTSAEDLKVAAILEMDNTARTYFSHYDWKPVMPDPTAPFALLAGQEAPRTGRLGHTIQLNINGPLRDTGHYLLYHTIFEKTRAQGGLAGYAHAADQYLGFSRNPVPGMAIDVPFGIVDFAEVMSLHTTGPAIWFDFLNLGYKIVPTAGTDYPWGGPPGTVRNYVRLDKPFTPQVWLESLKAGRTFITSGPMLEFTVNGQDMGAELDVKSGEPIVIKAKASMNPDWGLLSSLELIEQGDTVKIVPSNGDANELALRYDSIAKSGTWFVIRARGKNSKVVALSAPIYVLTDGQSFWKRWAVPRIVAKLKAQMQAVLLSDLPDGTERFEAEAPFTTYWNAQKGLLKERIDQANALYDDLLRRAAASP